MVNLVVNFNQVLKRPDLNDYDCLSTQIQLSVSYDDVAVFGHFPRVSVNRKLSVQIANYNYSLLVAHLAHICKLRPKEDLSGLILTKSFLMTNNTKYYFCGLPRFRCHSIKIIFGVS